MKRHLIALALCAAASAPAQSTNAGPLAFRIPASARILGMADLGVVGRDDDVLFYNPAQLLVARGTSASVERMSPDVRGGTTSTNLRLGSGAFGIGVNYLEYRAAYAVYPLSRADILAAPPTFPSGASMHAALGYALAVKGLRLGLSANYGVDEIGLDRFRNVAADVGVAKDFNRWTTGLSLQHLGAPMSSGVYGGTGDSIKQPMKATLGGGWSGPAGPLDVVAIAGVSGTLEGHVSPAIGGEAAWSWLTGFSIAARAGARYPANVDDPKYTAGLGFTADRTTFDAAAEVMSNNKVGLRFGIRVR